MGWWSATVLGGDGPLDWLGNLNETMGNKYNYDTDAPSGPLDYGYVFTREQVEEHMPVLIERCLASRWDKEVAFQVLGVMAMAVGAEIPEEAKAMIVDAAERDDACWRDEPADDRKKYMRDLVEKIESHEAGQITLVNKEGLFEKIFANESPMGS